MDVAVLYKDHRMTASILMSHRGGRHKKHQPLGSPSPPPKTLRRSSSRHQRGSLQRNDDIVDTSYERAKGKSSGFDSTMPRSRHQRSDAQSRPPKSKEASEATLMGTTNGESNKKKRKDKKNSNSRTTPASQTNSSSRRPSLLKPDSKTEKTSPSNHRRDFSWKSFFSFGSGWSTSSTSHDESASTFVPSRCKSIAKCFDDPYVNDSMDKNGNDSIADDVLLPAEVLELPATARSQSSASSVSYTSTFVIPSPQSSAFFSHQESILAKTTKTDVRDKEGRKSPRRKRDEFASNGSKEDDLWVERYYMNRKYEPVTYYRSVTNPDQCVLHEPPTGVNASNIIQMEDLQSAMRLLVMGKHQNHQTQEEQDRISAGTGFQRRELRSTAPRLSEYIEKSRHEDRDMLACRDDRLTTSLSNHPYPRTIEVSIASSGASIGSESYSSKASLLNADYNKKVATTEAIRKLMLDPLNGKIQDMILSCDSNKHHSKRSTKTSRTVSRTPAASGAVRSSKRSRQHKTRKSSRHRHHHRRMNLWQRLFPQSQKSTREKDQPPRDGRGGIERSSANNSKHNGKARTSRPNRYYSSLNTTDDGTHQERVHTSCREVKEQRRNNIASEFPKEMDPDATHIMPTMRGSLTRCTAVNSQVKKSNSSVVLDGNRKPKKCDKVKPRTMSLPTSSCNTDYGIATTKPDPPEVSTGGTTTATSNSSSFSSISVGKTNNYRSGNDNVRNGSVGSASSCSLSSLRSEDSLTGEA